MSKKKSVQGFHLRKLAFIIYLSPLIPIRFFVGLVNVGGEGGLDRIDGESKEDAPEKGEIILSIDKFSGKVHIIINQLYYSIYKLISVGYTIAPFEEEKKTL